jgi:hypothetical protein
MRADSLGTLSCAIIIVEERRRRSAVQVLFLVNFWEKAEGKFLWSIAASGCKGGRLFSPPSRGLCFSDAVIIQVVATLARRRAVAAAAEGRNIFAATEGPTRDAPAREMTSTDQECLDPRSDTPVGANAVADAPKTRRMIAPLNIFRRLDEAVSPLGNNKTGGRSGSFNIGPERGKDFQKFPFQATNKEKRDGEPDGEHDVWRTGRQGAHCPSCADVRRGELAFRPPRQCARSRIKQEKVEVPKLYLDRDPWVPDEDYAAQEARRGASRGRRTRNNAQRVPRREAHARGLGDVRREFFLHPIFFRDFSLSPLRPHGCRGHGAAAPCARRLCDVECPVARGVQPGVPQHQGNGCQQIPCAF